MKRHGMVTPRGTDRRQIIEREHREDRPRDNLSGAIAGDENKGPANHHKKGEQHGTKTKERQKDRL